MACEEPYSPLVFLRHGGCFLSFSEYFARATNLFLWLVLLSTTMLLLHRLIHVISLWAHGTRIPGPPVIPSILLLRRSSGKLSSARDLTGYLLDIHHHYGSLVKLWLSPTKLIISVTDVAIIKEILVKAKDKFPLTGRTFPLAFGRSNIFFSSYEKVKDERDHLALYMNEVLLERVNKIPMKAFEWVLGRAESTMSKGSFDCKSVSRHISFSILGTTLFEETFFSWSNATLYEELLGMIANEACFWASYKVPPLWKRGYWRYQSQCSRLKELTQEVIDQCDSLSHEETIGGHLISQEEPCGNIMSMMLHGFLTIATLVCSILTRLVLHPELQEKLFSEIDDLQRKASSRDSYDVEKMHLLLAVIYESARLLPPSPLLQRCSLNQDLNLESNITVPAEAIVVVPLQLVQTNRSIWGEDACQFNPHRFVSKAINKQGKSDEHEISELCEDAAYLPFGYGSRACMGQKFAILGISKLLASLLHNYEMKLETSSENETKMTNDNFCFPLLSEQKIVFLKRNT